MGKKVKGSVLYDYEKLKNEIIRDKVDEIFRKHPKDYIAKMEELGFEYFEDDDDEIEERSAESENQRQRDLVAYFEGKKKLSKKILESYFEEKAAENPNYPLIRNYYKKANKNLKSEDIFACIAYGAESARERFIPIAVEGLKNGIQAG